MENMFSNHGGIRPEISGVSGNSPNNLEIKLHTFNIVHGLKKKSQGKTKCFELN